MMPLRESRNRSAPITPIPARNGISGNPCKVRTVPNDSLIEQTLAGLDAGGQGRILNGTTWNEHTGAVSADARGDRRIAPTGVPGRRPYKIHMTDRSAELLGVAEMTGAFQ
jgi:hypothetical protein